MKMGRKNKRYYEFIVRAVLTISMALVITVLWIGSFPLEREIEYHDIITESIFLVLMFVIYVIIVKFRAKTVMIEMGWLFFLFKVHIDLIDEFTDDPDLFGSYIPNVIGIIGVLVAIIGVYRLYKGRSRQLDESLKVRRRLKVSEERYKNILATYKNILANIEESYFEVSLDGELLFFNDSLCRTLQYSREELFKMSCFRYIDEARLRKVINIFKDRESRGKKSRSFDLELVRRDGSRLQAEVSISSVYDDEGKRVGYRGLARDVSERRKVEEVNAYLAYHDCLTGLSNRQSFNEHIREAIAYSSGFGTRLAIFYLDLDNFKQVNDRFSHEVGDRLLCAVADRLKGALRETDLLFRIGGDEFIILFSNIIALNLNSVARELTKQISSPYWIEGNHIDFVGVSIGISIYPDDTTSCRELINYADSSMYNAKSRGNSFSYYDKSEVEVN